MRHMLSFCLGVHRISSKYSQFDPLWQYFQQVSGWPIIEAPFALLNIEMEMVFWDAVVAPQMTFGLLPESLNSVDVIPVFAAGF
jgi:hypothetical protein